MGLEYQTKAAKHFMHREMQLQDIAPLIDPNRFKRLVLYTI
jgi:hypothetical protein